MKFGAALRNSNSGQFQAKCPPKNFTMIGTNLYTSFKRLSGTSRATAETTASSTCRQWGTPARIIVANPAWAHQMAALLHGSTSARSDYSLTGGVFVNAAAFTRE